MEINVEKQKEFLSSLGAIDGRLNATSVTIEALWNETEKLQENRKELLNTCQHIDEEGHPALSGSSLFVWCQICGKVLTEEEVETLDKYENEMETEKTE